MDVNTDLLSNHEYSTSDSSMIIEDSIDNYLVDPNLTVSDMIEQYDVPMINVKRKKEKKNLLCAVCGENAVGYNFDQVSCESCKAFFRRNALRDINELRCRFSGTCNITIENRRHCPCCRIKKCFAVGMKKEWIRSEEEKHSKRLQLERNRRRTYSQQTIKISDLMVFKRSNNLMILSQTDRIRLNNITHCYDKFSSEPTVSGYRPSSKLLLLRLDELFNRKRETFINFVSYFKHLPELQILNVDDQVSLIKQNIRLLSPLNYALLRAAINSKFGTGRIQTIGCKDNINLHDMFRSLADIFVDFVRYDSMIIKLLVIVLFFTTNSLTTRSIYDPGQYQQLNIIKQIQSSYMELLWLYMIEKYGEKNAIHLFTRMITKYLHVQIIIDQADSIIQINDDIQNLDPLMKTMLQLT